MLLRDADVFSMATGWRSVCPLLDHKLVEAVTALPEQCKRGNGRVKPLLVDAVGPRLPEVVKSLPQARLHLPWTPGCAARFGRGRPRH